MKKTDLTHSKIFLLGLFLTALLGAGCKPKEKSEEVLKAEKIVAALDAYAEHFKQEVEKKGKAIGKNIKLNFAFLPHAEEARLEGVDFFANWEKTNKDIVAKNFPNIAAAAGFDNGEGFVVMAIGSSSTQGYYKENGVVKGLGYLFGTDPSDDKDALMDKMVTELKKLGKPVIFVNSIGFARKKGSTEDENKAARALALDETVEFDQEKDEKDSAGKKTGNKVPDTAGITAKVLASKLKANSIANAAVFAPGEEKKLVNKWTMALIQESPEFKDGVAGFVGDIGGKGFSVKPVANNTFDDKNNLVKKLDPKVSDEYNDQKDIVAAYAAGPDAGYIHPTLTKIINTINDAMAWEFANEKDTAIKAKFDSQKEDPSLVRQTGQLRELYEKNKAIIDAAAKDGATASIRLISSDAYALKATKPSDELLAA